MPDGACVLCLGIIGKNACAGKALEGRAVYKKRLGHGRRLMHLVLTEPLADASQVGDAVEGHHGLHVGALLKEVALVPGLLAVGRAHHLHEVAARGVAENADVRGINAVLIGMGAQKAHRGLGVV